MPLTYSTLIADKDTDGSVKNWANYALLPVATILTNAQALIYERLRVREMRVEQAVTVTILADHIDVPAGFLDPIQLLLDGDGRPVDYVHENLLGPLREETGVLTEGPISRYAIIDEDLKFDVRSSEARTGFLWFYKSPAELAVTTNETNFLTARYPQLLLDACMIGALNFRKLYAERNDMMALVMDGIEAANIASDMGRRGQTMR